MIAWLVQYAAIISGLLGLLSAFVLAWPLVGEMSDRKDWDLLKRFKQKRTLAPQEQAALASLREQLIDERLGNYVKTRFVTVLGLVGLAGAFVFLIVDALERMAAGSG